MQFDTSFMGLIIVIVVALVLWRILKKAIGGCISAGIGCLVLILGLVAVGLYVASQSGVTNLRDIWGLIGR